MTYEINVSLNGVHYFATHPRSLITEREADAMFAAFCAKFPRDEGYHISCSVTETSGTVRWTTQSGLGCKPSRARGGLR